MTERGLAAGAALAAILLLSGCAGGTVEPAPSPTSLDLSTYDPESAGNGVTLLSPAAARDTAVAALRASGATTMSGTYRDAASGRTLAITRTGSSERFTAEITVDGAATTIGVDGADAWVNPSTSVAAAAGVAAGAWACVSSDDALVQRWMPLLSPPDLIDALTADAAGLSAPGESSVDVLLGAEGTAGVLTVATSGQPLPTRLVRADATGTVDVTFSGGDAEAEPAPPADC